MGWGGGGGGGGGIRSWPSRSSAHRDLAPPTGRLANPGASENDLGNLLRPDRAAEAAASAYFERSPIAAAGRDAALPPPLSNPMRHGLPCNGTIGPARVLLARAVDLLPAHASPLTRRRGALVAAGSARSMARAGISSGGSQIAGRASRRLPTRRHAAQCDPLLAGARRLGNLYERTGRVGQASRLTEEALFAAQRALRVRYAGQTLGSPNLLGPHPNLSYRLGLAAGAPSLGNIDI